MSRWAAIGNVNEEFSERAEALLKKWGPYKTKRDSHSIYFGISLSSRGRIPLIERSKWLDSSTIEQLDLSNFTRLTKVPEFDKFKIDPELVSSLASIIRSKQGPQKLERYNRIILGSSLSQLPLIMKEIIGPEFFSEYPKGQIIFLNSSPNLHLSLAAIRILGFSVELGNRDFQVFKDIGHFELLSDVQYTGLINPGKYISIPFALFLPRLYGFVTSRVGMSFLFLLDNPRPEVREFYPQSVFEYIRSSASNLFRQSVDLEIDEMKPENLDKFALINHEYSSNQFRKFIDVYISKLNDFFRYMIDPGNFIDQNSSEWIGLSHYRAWLSFERISDEVIYMLTENTAFLRKMTLFRILDQFTSLATENRAEQTKIFKNLLLPEENEDPISIGLAKYGGVIGNYLINRLKEVRQELKDVVLASIYLPDRVDTIQGTVKLSDSTIISENEYVTNTVRELRNTYHGYYTNGFNKYLSMSTGNTPDSLPIIGALAYLAFLAQPEQFISRTW